MIKYNLKCSSKNCEGKLPFDAWFKDSKAFESQKKSRLLTCPYCGGIDVIKNLMSPSIQTKKTSKKINSQEETYKESLVSKKKIGDEIKNTDVPVNDAMTLLRTIKKEIQKNADFVGDRFVEEARAINLGKTKERPIYGNAKSDEIDELKEEGIEVTSIPWIQDDH